MNFWLINNSQQPIEKEKISYINKYNKIEEKIS